MPIRYGGTGKPNTMGKERAETIAASLPDSEQELAAYLWQFAS